MLVGYFDWLIFFFPPLIFWNPKNKLPELLESYCWINWQRQNFSASQQIEPLHLNLHNSEPTFSPFWAKDTGQCLAEACRRCLALWIIQVFFMSVFFFQEGKLAGGDASRDKEWQEEHGAVAAGGKQQGKKSQSGTSFSVFNTTSKAGL